MNSDAYVSAQYSKDIQKYDLLSPEREKELYKMLVSKDEIQINQAREELITTHLRLVIKLANEAFNKCVFYKKNSALLMDLIEEGNIHLIKLTKSFDPRKGRYMTYAYNSLQGQIRSSLYELTNMIHVPRGHWKYWKQIEELKKKYGEKISDELIMEELDIPESFLEKLRQGKDSSNMEMLDNTEDWEDWKNLDTTEVREYNDLMEYLVKLMDKKFPSRDKLTRSRRKIHMDEREKDLIKKYYFSDNHPTLEQIAKEENLTRERIRQRLAKASHKLRQILMREFEETHPEILAEKPVYHTHYLVYRKSMPIDHTYNDQVTEYNIRLVDKLIKHFLHKTKG